MTTTQNSHQCVNITTIAISRHRREGITLLEVVIAAMVLVIGLLSFFAVFLNCTRLDETSKESIIAINHAQIQMERLRALDFESIDDEDGDEFAVPGLLPVITGDNEGFIYVNSSNPDLLDVTVSVKWAGITGDRQLDLKARFVKME